MFFECLEDFFLHFFPGSDLDHEFPFAFNLLDFVFLRFRFFPCCVCFLPLFGVVFFSLQIFGRAGRPQFDKSGEAWILTTEQELPNYLRLLTAQLPIESQFETALPNHLNAEVILGTVTNMQEAVRWLSYTFFFTRMLRNPTVGSEKLFELLCLSCV